jgi:enterochelin esterase family protein
VPPLRQATIRSRRLDDERRVWLQTPAPARRPAALCILLDGEYYVERMEAPAHLEAEQTASALPPIALAYVSHVDAAVRWTDSFCNYRFAAFIGEELLPWAAGQFGLRAENTPVILGGLSLTGLAAAHAALTCGASISAVLCQSASFWWSDGRFIAECRQRRRLPLRFRISCGTKETIEYVEHGPGLVQRTSQLASNRLMRDVLVENGWDVSYEEFNGGHDLGSWRADLPNSLRALLPDDGRAPESPA